MPITKVVLYRTRDGKIPVLAWMRKLPQKVQNKCYVRIEKLCELGHELRRPLGDYLREGIYELRIKHRHDQYRILYFFHGQDAVILSHGLKKETRIPDKEIERAARQKEAYYGDPKTHTAEMRE